MVPTVELASRERAGLRVALLWEQQSDVVTVSVDDVSSGERFELVVEPVNALDAYYHPYAYASDGAVRGLRSYHSLRTPK